MLPTKKKTKNIPAISKLILAYSFIALFSSCENKKPQGDAAVQDAPVRKTETKSNQYTGLRNMALNMTPAQIGEELPVGQTKVYGVIMDWNLGNVTVTLTGFLSGDASLYLSSGAGVIGGIGHKEVSTQAKAFVNEADKYLQQVTKTDSTPLPGNGKIKFYFLTSTGRYVAEEDQKNIDNHTSKWQDLFTEGNKLMTELRLVADKP